MSISPGKGQVEALQRREWVNAPFMCPQEHFSLWEEEDCISHHPSVTFTEGFPGATEHKQRVSTWCWWGGLRQLWGKTTPHIRCQNSWRVEWWMNESFLRYRMYLSPVMFQWFVKWNSVWLPRAGFLALNRLCSGEELVITGWSSDKIALETRTTCACPKPGTCAHLHEWFLNEFILREVGQNWLMSPWGKFRVGREGELAPSVATW